MTFEAGTYTIEVGIVDPLTGEAGIAFANEPANEDGRMYRVMEFTVH